MGSIHGLMLTAWGSASAVGPVLIAHVRQPTGKYSDALVILAVVMAGDHPAVFPASPGSNRSQPTLIPFLPHFPDKFLGIFRFQ
jgi:hypothetical protein